jgi:nucleoside-diphosphate-sugar epimerase
VTSQVRPSPKTQSLPESCQFTGPLEPTNEWYEIAKIAGPKLCQAYRRQHGCDFVSEMPTNLYGPKDNFVLLSSHVLPALIAKIDGAVRHNEDLRGVVDAGHQRDGAVIRTFGDDHEPRRFSVWAPLVIAAIRHLGGTIEDRSIKIPMRRRRPDESVSSPRLDRASKLDELARQAARWAKDNADSLAEVDPAMPATIYNRAADNWRPLLAMAELAGGEWPNRARQTAIELSGAGDETASTGCSC